jgi:hypothetical protein
LIALIFGPIAFERLGQKSRALMEIFDELLSVKMSTFRVAFDCAGERGEQGVSVKFFRCDRLDLSKPVNDGQSGTLGRYGPLFCRVDAHLKSRLSRRTLCIRYTHETILVR